MRVQNERDVECSSQVSEEDSFETLKALEDENCDRFDYKTENMISAFETNLVRETLFSALFSTDVLPAEITDDSLNLQD